MTVFTIGIADYAVEIHAIYDSTKTFCQGYLTDREPDLSVTVTPEDILFERKKSAGEDTLDDLSARAYYDPYLN